jgi:hypothetical protein
VWLYATSGHEVVRLLPKYSEAGASCDQGGAQERRADRRTTSAFCREIAYSHSPYGSGRAGANSHETGIPLRTALPDRGST